MFRNIDSWMSGYYDISLNGSSTSKSTKLASYSFGTMGTAVICGTSGSDGTNLTKVWYKSSTDELKRSNISNYGTGFTGAIFDELSSDGITAISIDSSQGFIYVATTKYDYSKGAIKANIYRGSYNLITGVISDVWMDITGSLPNKSLVYAMATGTANKLYVSSRGLGEWKTELCPFSILLNASNPTCGVLNDGSITLMADPAPATPTSYLWSNGVTLRSGISSLTEGVYTVTVTDANSCTLTQSINLVSLAATISMTPVKSNGASTGTATVSAYGGSNTYTYIWSDAASTATSTLDNIAQGTYTVTVTDGATTCTVSQTITVTEPAVLAVSVTSQTDPLCSGGTDGSIDITVAGGTNDYTYEWSNGTSIVDDTEDIGGLPGGIYTVTVNDKAGCSATASAVITAPSANFTLAAVTQDVSCNGGTDGFITLTCTSTVAYPISYSFVWSNGAATQNVSNLAAGQYTVTVTSTAGTTVSCNTLTLTVTEPSGVKIEVISLCLSTGTIVVKDVLSYSYSWSDGQTTETATGLTAGIYTVRVDDSSTGKCAVKTIELTEAVSINVINPSCNGGEDGIATAFFVPGSVTNGPYSYLWSNSSSTKSIDGLSPDIYTVTANYNDGGCTSTVAVIVSNPPLFVVTVTDNLSSSSSCSNGAGRPLCTNPTGNSYLWSTGETSACINPPTPDTYSVTVIDANGCSATASYDQTSMSTTCCGNYVNDFTNTSGTYSGPFNLNSDIVMTSGTITLSGCTLAIAPNVDIYVCDVCTLEIINSSHLYACSGDMWSGIMNNGVVIIDGSEIDDAHDALSGYYYLPPAAEFHVTNSIFDRNFNGVHIFWGDFSTSEFTGNSFECTGSLKSKLGDYSNYHFYLQDVSNFTLGGTIGKPNNLKDADRGIESNNSTFNCTYNYFYNIGYSIGTAIYAYNDRFGNRIDVNENNIENCIHGGVIGENYDCELKYNTFTNCYKGTLIADYTEHLTSIMIHDNGFYNCTNTGIDLYNISNFSDCEVNNNVFRGAFDADGIPANGAAVEAYIPGSLYNGTLVEDNIIENYQVGIHATASFGYGYAINDNSITYTFDKDHIGTASYYGIWTQGSQHAAIGDNVIDWVSGPYDPSNNASQLQGVRTEGSLYVYIVHNKFNRMGTGIYMNSDANGNIMKCNSMIKNYPGVFLDNVSNLPDQGSLTETFGNYWEGDFTSYFKVNGINTPPVKWYYESTASSEYSPVPSDPFVNATPITGGTNNCPFPLFMRTSSAENILDKIVKDSVSYDYSIAPDEMRYNSRENAYKAMKADNTLVSNAAREEFMQQTESENIGLLTAVTDTIAAGDLATAETINDAVNDTNTIEYNKRTVNDIIIQRTINGVLALTATDSATLLTIALQDGMHGGEAVYRARAILRLRIADNYGGYGARTIKDNLIDKPKQTSVEVFPVPSTGLVYIKADNALLNVLKVYDVAGRLLNEIHLKTPDSFYQLDLSNLLAGYYTIEVTDNSDKNYSRQIVLTK
jgi:hypothetical protein